MPATANGNEWQRDWMPRVSVCVCVWSENRNLKSLHKFKFVFYRKRIYRIPFLSRFDCNLVRSFPPALAVRVFLSTHVYIPFLPHRLWPVHCILNTINANSTRCLCARKCMLDVHTRRTHGTSPSRMWEVDEFTISDASYLYITCLRTISNQKKNKKIVLM